MDEGTHRCCQRRACVDEGPARAVRHVGEVGGASREEDSTTVVAPIEVEADVTMVVGVDEVVGVDDGDELVLDEDEGGGRVAAAATEVAAAAAKEERWRLG